MLGNVSHLITHSRTAVEDEEVVVHFPRDAVLTAEEVDLVTLVAHHDRRVPAEGGRGHARGELLRPCAGCRVVHPDVGEVLPRAARAADEDELRAHRGERGPAARERL